MEPLSQSSIRTPQSQTSSKRCDCGLPSPMKTSSTSVNYGRKFYGCGKFEETGRRGCRFFEWVDTEYLETTNIDSWNEWEEEMVLLRAREAEMFEELKKFKEILRLKENELNEYKNEIVKLKWELKKFEENDSFKCKCSFKLVIIFFVLVGVMLFVVNENMKLNRYGKEMLCLP